MRALVLGIVAALWAVAAGATTYPVGERHLTTPQPTAALRDARHSDALRITVWYPAAASAEEQEITLGPPGQPLFYIGEVAPNAAFADDRRRPVILFSHGFGGTARMMGWFGMAMASQGYVVVAVDHPGNNGADPMTVAGATMFWERPGDLAAALARVRADPDFFRHLDIARVGVAGFSAGGFTSLAAAGARVDLDRFKSFCADHPTDGVCAPQKEFTVTMDQAQAFLASSEAAPAVARAPADHTIPEVRAAFAIAPAIVQALDPKSLADLRLPVAIVLGDSDPVAPPNTNGGVAARTIPGARLKVLPGVGHYDFLAQCTPAGDAIVKELCPVRVPRSETHHKTVEQALIFFGQTMGPPP